MSKDCRFFDKQFQFQFQFRRYDREAISVGNDNESTASLLHFTLYNKDQSRLVLLTLRDAIDG